MGVTLQNATWADSDLCEICLEPLNADSIANPSEGAYLVAACPNQHVFHKGCIAKYRAVNSDAKCPSCRSPLLSSVPAQDRMRVVLVGPPRPANSVTRREVDPDGDMWVYRMPDNELQRIEGPQGTWVTESVWRNPPSGIDEITLVQEGSSNRMVVVGPRGQERLRSIFEPTSRVLTMYAGPRFREAKRQEQRPDPDGSSTPVNKIYEGPINEERLVRVRHPNGSVSTYEGARDHEVLRSVMQIDRGLQIHEGDPGEERLVTVRWPNGNIIYYEGRRGEERMVRAIDEENVTRFYEGPSDQERLVRTQTALNVITHYEGGTGEERKVRMEYPGGDVAILTGPRGHECVTQMKRRGHADAQEPSTSRQRTDGRSQRALENVARQDRRDRRAAGLEVEEGHSESDYEWNSDELRTAAE